ncbi:hypothetical protein DNTS_005910, partial [Danionella cerebrum]
IDQRKLQESVALTQTQILCRNTINMLQRSFLKSSRSRDDIPHVQHTQIAVTSSFQNQTYQRRTHKHAQSTNYRTTAFLSPAAEMPQAPVSSRRVLDDVMDRDFEFHLLCSSEQRNQVRQHQRTENKDEMEIKVTYRLNL